MTKPKIGLSMLYTLSKPFKKMTSEICKTGTTNVEIVDDGLHVLNKRRTAVLNDIRKSCDIKYVVHAPFAGINITMPSKPLLSATLKRLKQSIVNASALDCRVWVFHPGMRTGTSGFYPGVDWIRNLDSVRLLVRFAKDHGVEACIENAMDPFVLTSASEFKRFYSEIDDDVGLVLDTGHANLIGQVDAFLKELPDRIKHIHAHDNLGLQDQHLGIGYGSIDWTSFSKLLKETSFDGVVMIESIEHIPESIAKLRQLLE
jgi:sugar phosphate isomerase/epimerase